MKCLKHSHSIHMLLHSQKTFIWTVLLCRGLARSFRFLLCLGWCVWGELGEAGGEFRKGCGLALPHDEGVILVHTQPTNAVVDKHILYTIIDKYWCTLSSSGPPWPSCSTDSSKQIRLLPLWQISVMFPKSDAHSLVGSQFAAFK